MPNPFTDLLTGGLGGLLDGIKGIISEFVVDPKAKLEATQKMAELEVSFKEKQIEAETAYVTQQANVIIAEAKSDSWIARNWRPLTMLTFVSIVVWNYIVIGTIGAFTHTISPIPIPPDMWNLLQLGIGGYIGARTAEKIAMVVSDNQVKKEEVKK